MEEQKPKSVKIIGLLVAIFSCFIILSNGLGALSFSLMGMDNDETEIVEPSEFNLIEFLYNNYLTMCLIMLVIGILYFIGGLNIRKYKLWANRLITSLSILLLILFWTLTIAMINMIAKIPKQHGLEMISFLGIIGTLFWSTPIGLLIWFLNREKIKKHFV